MGINGNDNENKGLTSEQQGDSGSPIAAVTERWKI